MKAHRFFSTGFTRRQGLAGLPLAAMAFLMTGCSEKPGNVEVAVEGAAPAGAEQKVVSVYTFDEYLDPALMAEFTARTGIAVDLKFYEETDEMVEGLKSNPGDYDIFICEDGYIPILAGKRMMKKLDLSRFTQWKNMDPARLNQPFDPGNQFTVPYLWGTTLLAYRKDLLPEPKQSWSLIFDPAVKDRVSFMNERMESYAGVLRTMNLSLPDADEAAISQAADKLVMLVEQQGLKMGSEKDVKQHLLEGTSALSMMYSGDAARLAEENPDVPLGYFIPEEGATVWTDSFCISLESTRVDNAYLFLDFMMEAKSAAASTNFAHYASPNLAATPYIEEQLLANKTINPDPAVLAKCQYFKLSNVNGRQWVNTGWRRVQEAWLKKSNQVIDLPEDPDSEGELSVGSN